MGMAFCATPMTCSKRSGVTGRGRLLVTVSRNVKINCAFDRGEKNRVNRQIKVREGEEREENERDVVPSIGHSLDAEEPVLGGLDIETACILWSESKERDVVSCRHGLFDPLFVGGSVLWHIQTVSKDKKQREKERSREIKRKEDLMMP